MTKPSNPRARASLEWRLADLQAKAFEIYEAAAARAEVDPCGADASYADAERESAPLIERARRLNAERVQMLRNRARHWWSAAIAIALIGGCALLWLLSMRR